MKKIKYTFSFSVLYWPFSPKFRRPVQNVEIVHIIDFDRISEFFPQEPFDVG